MGKINDFGFPFTSVTGDRQYSASEWRDYFGKLIKNGVIQNDGNVVAVVQQVSANKTVSVGTGSIFINGVMFINDSAKTLSITDNTSGNPRKDRIVARLNYTDRKIEFGVLIGTPGGSPVAPTLTRNTTVYELGIADITLANGFSTIVTANILDTRSDVDLCGASSMTIGVIPASGADAETIQLSAGTEALYGVSNVDLALGIINTEINSLAPTSLFNLNVFDIVKTGGWDIVLDTNRMFLDSTSTVSGGATATETHGKPMVFDTRAGTKTVTCSFDYAIYGGSSTPSLAGIRFINSTGQVILQDSLSTNTTITGASTVAITIPENLVIQGSIQLFTSSPFESGRYSRMYIKTITVA